MMGQAGREKRFQKKGDLFYQKGHIRTPYNGVAHGVIAGVPWEAIQGSVMRAVEWWQIKSATIAK